jgi:short-subunit dehydrogenase
MYEKGPAIIVGYGAGIAASFVNEMVVEGHPLVLVARNKDKLAAAAAALSKRGVYALSVAADAGDAAALERAIKMGQAAFGAPDLVLYNAAHWRPGPVLQATAENLVEDFRIDVVGALVAAKAVAPEMVRRGRGTILFTGERLALFPSRKAPSLSIGKAGLRALALMLAAELAPEGIRVGTVTVMGTVAPGTTSDPDRIAQALLSLHRTAPDPATAEIVFGG